MGSRNVIWLLVLVLAVLLAGCSDDQSRERDYAEGVLDAHAALDRADAAARATEGKVAGADAEELQALEQAARQAHERVRALEPPSDLREEDERILEALAKVEAGARGMAAGSAATTDRIRESQQTYLAGMVAFEDELATLRRTRG